MKRKPSGPRSGISVALSATRVSESCLTVKGSSRRSGFPTRNSTSPKTCCAARTTKPRFFSAPKTRPSTRSAIDNFTSRWRASPHGSRRRVCVPAIASPPTCQTSPKRWWRCWPRPASARCGPRPHPTSAKTASSTASARPSRAFCLPPTDISITARSTRWRTRSTPFVRSFRASNGSCKSIWSASASRRACSTGARSSPRRRRRLISSRAISTTRCTYSTPRALPVNRNASPTRSAVR